jgi:hypothetical protein
MQFYVYAALRCLLKTYVSVYAIVVCISHNRSSVRGHESFEIQILMTIPGVFLTWGEY